MPTVKKTATWDIRQGKVVLLMWEGSDVAELRLPTCLGDQVTIQISRNALLDLRDVLAAATQPAQESGPRA